MHKLCLRRHDECHKREGGLRVGLLAPLMLELVQMICCCEVNELSGFLCQLVSMRRTLLFHDVENNNREYGC